MHKDIEEVLITEQQLQKKVRELGRQITSDYQGRPLLLLCVLKGALMFLADLAREIDLALEMDFILEGDRRSMHVLNAVSPAFTCSLPFSRYVGDRIGALLN